MELNMSFKGNATDLIKLNSDGTAIVKKNGEPVIESATIDYTNGYDVFRQAGKYYALDFVKRMVSKEDYYNEDGFNTAFTQTDAQEMFLKSGTDMSVSDERYAMYVDGSWWEAEANIIFNNMAKKDSKYSKQNRKFGWMSLPKANKLKFEEGNSVFLDSLEAAVCVKANLGANKKAAFSGKGALYPVCDGKVTSVEQSDDGKYTITVSHSGIFKTIIRGADFAYCDTGEDVFRYIPVCYVNGGEATVTMYDEDVVVTNFVLENGSIIWSV